MKHVECKNSKNPIKHNQPQVLKMSAFNTEGFQDISGDGGLRIA